MERTEPMFSNVVVQNVTGDSRAFQQNDLEFTHPCTDAHDSTG